MKENVSDRPNTETEKFEFEKEARLREIALKEKEQELAERDFDLRRTIDERSRWSNPLVVAIFAAAIAGVGNATVSIINGLQQRIVEREKNTDTQQIEESKAESSRILEVIKTGDTERAASNLAFLLDAGLISNLDFS